MKIEKKDQIHDDKNPMKIPESTPQASPQAKKISSVSLGAIGALGNITQPTGEMRINMDLLTIELHEIEHMAMFALNPLGQLIITSDPAQSVMYKIGKLNIIKEPHYDAVMANMESTDEQIMVIPEELWGEMHIQIGNLIPLLLAIISETEKLGPAEKELPATSKRTTPPAPSPAPAGPRSNVKGGSKSMQWKLAMTLFLDQKTLKASKERHENEKAEEQIAEKEDRLRKEIEKFEEMKSRVKESATKEEMLTHLKNWAESLPPCPPRFVNEITIRRELLKNCLVQIAMGSS